MSCSKELGEIDLQSAIRHHVGPGDGRRFVLRKDDRILGANAAAGRAALAAIVRLFHEDRFGTIDAIHAEQAEVDALHAVGATAVIDHRIPAASRFFIDTKRGRVWGVECRVWSESIRTERQGRVVGWIREAGELLGRRSLCRGAIACCVRRTVSCDSGASGRPPPSDNRSKRVILRDPLHFRRYNGAAELSIAGRGNTFVPIGDGHEYPRRVLSRQPRRLLLRPRHLLPA